MNYGDCKNGNPGPANYDRDKQWKSISQVPNPIKYSYMKDKR